MAPPPGYTLVFEDHFNGVGLDLNKWFKYGLPEHIVVQNSNLVIGPSSCGVRGCNGWGNAATSCKFKFKNGYVEYRAKLAGPGTGTGTNRGFCSQLWLMKAPGETGQEINLTETASGPIDNTNSNNGINKMVSSMHCPDQPTSRTKVKNTGKDLSADYHIYATEWTPTYVRYLFDEVEVNRFTSVDGICIPSGNMYLVAGLCAKHDVTKPDQCWPATEKAVGSGKLYVDYIRVYQRSNQQLTKIALSPSAIFLKVGATQQLNAQCEAGTTIIDCPSLEWSSDNTAIATVNSTGTVSAISPGTAAVIAKSGTITSNAVTVTVTTLKYKCINGECTEDDSGIYDSIEECKAACAQEKIKQVKELNNEIILLEKEVNIKEEELKAINMTLVTKNAELRLKIIQL